MNAKEFRYSLLSQYTQEHHDSETFLVGREQWELLVMERYAKHKIEEAVKKMEAKKFTEEFINAQDYGSILHMKNWNSTLDQAITTLKNL